MYSSHMNLACYINPIKIQAASANKMHLGQIKCVSLLLSRFPPSRPNVLQLQTKYQVSGKLLATYHVVPLVV